MSRSSANFLATEAERIADADLDLAYLRHVARDVASRLAGIAEDVIELTVDDNAAGADVVRRLEETAADLHAAAGAKP